MEPSDEYHYSHIDSAHGEIRVLHVENGSKTDDIVCHFQHVHLSQKPYYIALSYCWGSHQKRAVIWLEGKSFKITMSVDAALRALRIDKPGMGQDAHSLDCDEVARAQSLVIWIDAICINQEDLDERSQQVKIMKNIYQLATQTIVWLGGNDEEAIIVQQLISRLQLEMASELGIDVSLRVLDLQDRIRRYKLENGFKFYPSTPPSKFLPPFDSPAWNYLASFYAQPWFTRMWVIQEVNVSRYPLLAYGNRRLNWVAVAGVAKWLSAVNIEFRSKRDKFAMLKYACFISTLTNGWTMYNLLRLARHFNATDRRDKIFALLGISKEEISRQPPASTLVPNYRLTVQEVYTNFTRHLLKAEGISDTFALVGHACDDGFPSWVPRWDLPCPCMRFREIPPFQASGNELQSVQETKDLNSLKIMGFRVDTVQFTSNVLDGDFDFLDPGILDLKGPYPNGEDILTAIRLTMVADCTSGGDRAADHPNHVYEFAGFLINYQQSLYQSLSKQVKSSIGTFYVLGSTDKGQKYRNAMQQATRGRRFFMTTKGYFGLGPSYMALQDRLCILLGGQTPYLLRRRSSFQTFIGECYLHGMMNGEAMEMMRLHKWPMEMLHLR